MMQRPRLSLRDWTRLHWSQWSKQPEAVPSASGYLWEMFQQRV